MMSTTAWKEYFELLESLEMPEDFMADRDQGENERSDPLHVLDANSSCMEVAVSSATLAIGEIAGGSELLRKE